MKMQRSLVPAFVLFAAVIMINGVPGCGGGDDGGGTAGTTGSAGATGRGGTTGAAGQGGTTGVAGTTGTAGDGQTAGTGGSGNGRGGNAGGNVGGRGGNGGNNVGRGGTGGGAQGGRGGGNAGRGGAGGRGGAAGGTGGGAAGGTGGAATFAQVATILGTSCGTGNCHDGSEHTDLRNNTGLYARIVNAMPAGSRVMSGCTSRTLIEPGDVASSVIAQAIMASVSGCTNARMPDECPRNRDCLTSAQIATITSWIMAGAPM